MRFLFGGFSLAAALAAPCLPAEAQGLGYRWNAPLPTEDVTPSIVEVEVRRDGEFFWLGQFTVYLDHAGQYFRTMVAPDNFEQCSISVGHYSPPGTRAQNDFTFSVGARSHQEQEVHWFQFVWSELAPRDANIAEHNLCAPEEQSTRTVSVFGSLELRQGTVIAIDLIDDFVAILRRRDCPDGEFCVGMLHAEPIARETQAPGPIANWRAYDAIFGRDSGEEIWRGALHLRDDGAGTSVTDRVSRPLLFPCRLGSQTRSLLTNYNSHLSIAWANVAAPIIDLSFTERWEDNATNEQPACLPHAGEDDPGANISTAFDPDGETLISEGGFTLRITPRAPE